MDWTSLVNLLPVVARLEPVIVKYGPAAIALYKADEAQALQLFADVVAAIEAPNPFSIISLVTKWGPTLAAFAQTEGPVVQQFIADVKAALGTAPLPSVPEPESSGSVIVFPPKG